jgi:hypothetical protein
MRNTGDHQHFFYARLVNDLAIYGLGLSKRDRTLARLRGLLDQYRQKPATFACTLVPRKAQGTPNGLRLINGDRQARTQDTVFRCDGFGDFGSSRSVQDHMREPPFEGVPVPHQPSVRTRGTAGWGLYRRKEWRSDFSATMDGNRHGPAIGVSCLGSMRVRDLASAG